MIRQHILQQERLKNNHERLLERYNTLLTPQVSHFRSFGTSSLPGRNYEQYLNSIHGNDNRRDSLVQMSRASIGKSGETRSWIGGKNPEILPKNINSIIQHSSQHTQPIVFAEKFEPVQVYEHPVFGPTPAYIRPVVNGDDHGIMDNDDDSDHDASHDTFSQFSDDLIKKTDEKFDDNDNENENENNHAPKGYISYKKWKAKYENLIPVDPLLFSIYIQRPNGSINSYGQSIVSPPYHHQQSIHDENLLTTLSDFDSSITSAARENSSLNSQGYHRLESPMRNKTMISRPLNFSIHPIKDDGDLSDDESSPPDSPVPLLSRNKPNHLVSTPAPTFGSLTRSPSPTPKITTQTKPTLPTVTTAAMSIPPSTSNIPPAPPLPPSLLPTTSLSKPMSVTSSSATYQVPSSNATINPNQAPSVSDAETITSQTKAVTFGNSSAFPVITNTKTDDAASSSSDSDGEENAKRR